MLFVLKSGKAAPLYSNVLYYIATSLCQSIYLALAATSTPALTSMPKLAWGGSNSLEKSFEIGKNLTILVSECYPRVLQRWYIVVYTTLE